MTVDSAVQAATILVGFAIAGEGFALLIGMHFLSESGNPWVSLRNDVLLVCDLSVGLGFIFVAVAGASDTPALWLVAAPALLAHAYREWEYVAGRDRRFCINRPLFAMNTAKLVSLAALMMVATVTAV